MKLTQEQENQVKRFIEMVDLYEQVADLGIDDTDTIEIIQNLSDNKNYAGIYALFNQDNLESAEDMLFDYFGVELSVLNKRADEFDIKRVE